MIDENGLDSMIDCGLRFGQIAIWKGFITRQQLDEALDEQISHNLHNDNHKTIGEILLEKGWMTEDQIAVVLDNSSKIKTCTSSYLKHSPK